MQSILDKWIKIDNIEINQDKFPPIFYLKWNSNRNRPFQDIQATFISKLPKYTFYKKVKWNSHYIFVVGNFNNTQLHQYSNEIFSNVPVLKSNLQKCIRRGFITQALKTAYCLMTVDFQSFIRRLPIIMIEDVILHNSFPTIIWMMIAYPQWQPSLGQIQWLLGVVHFLASCKTADSVIKEKLIPNNNNYLDIIYSLQIRKSFGGLPDDLTMINDYIVTWNNRFVKNEIPKEFLKKIQIINLNSMNLFTKEDIEYSAIDFHCFKIMLTWIHEKYSEYEKEDIKKAIWYGSSGYNKRHKKNILFTCDKLYKNIWKQISGEFYKTVKYLIYKLEE